MAQVMDALSADSMPERNDVEDHDQRGAKRYASLIRAAKLVSSQGEFVCVIRDVSSSGISIRTFHDVPRDEHQALELQNGDIYELRKVRGDGKEASFTFEGDVAVEKLIHEHWNYPKRQLRLNLSIPVSIATLTGKVKAVTLNISQQGACLEADAAFALDQTVRLESRYWPDVRAKVRWRRDGEIGVVFDNTFSLREFAVLAARTQCPQLLSSEDR